jgi:LEA14-like dessication related protein
MSVYWHVMSDDSDITGYEIELDGKIIPVDKVLECKVTDDIKNEKPYKFKVRAVNATGPSEWSDFSDPVVPAAPITVPDAPTSVVATPGDESVALTWEAPVNDGGSDITGYEIQHNDNETPIPVDNVTEANMKDGIENDKPCTFKVRAINAAGPSEWSNASASVTPASKVSVPDAPIWNAVLPGDGCVSLSWDVPANDGGSAVVGYDIQQVGNEQPIPVEGNVTECKMEEGIENGKACSFQVRAKNSVGPSEWSKISDVVTPVSSRPDAPTSVLATPDESSVALTWVAPVNNGGSEIVGYDIQQNDNETLIPVDGNVTDFKIEQDIKNDQPYTFKVRAKNASGSSEWSNTSDPVVPVASDVKRNDVDQAAADAAAAAADALAAADAAEKFAQQKKEEDDKHASDEKARQFQQDREADDKFWEERDKLFDDFMDDNGGLEDDDDEDPDAFWPQGAHQRNLMEGYDIRKLPDYKVIEDEYRAGKVQLVFWCLVF